MGKKVWNVVLVPEGEGGVRSLRIPARVIHGLTGFAVFGLVLLLVSIAFNFRNIRGRESAEAVRRENMSLRTHLSQVNVAMERIDRLVREGEQMEQQARMLAGLDPLDGQTRQLGVGGPLLDVQAEASVSDPAVASSIQDQKQRLDLLTRRASFQRQSLLETLDRLQDLGDRLAHTPSICPLRDPYVLSAGFGNRTDPITNQRAFHSGLDLRAPAGTAVHASAAGEVVFAGYDGEFGRCIRIRHGFGFETSYCHLGGVVVSVGQKVERGGTIGRVGSTGRSTGPHLHYEVLVNGVARDPSDHIFTPRTTAD